MKTITISENDIQKKWYHIDGKGITLGRLASKVTPILQGKNKPTYSNHLDAGDFVIITNASQVVLSGKKMDTKSYFRHSTRPGSGKFTSVSEVMEKNPTYPLSQAIKGMLPKNSLGRQMFKKLFVYAGEEHSHSAQQPENLTV